jgi:hypothetical protein
MTYLGLDLGSGFAKLARCTTGTPGQPAAGPAVTRVPAAMWYGEQGAKIPLDSPDPDEPRRRAVRCDGFPALLDTSLAASPVLGWRNRTPAQVAGHFLNRLLASPSVRLVAAVPPVQASPAASAEITAILTRADRPPTRVIAAPVAALLWLRDRYPALAGASRVIVVDAGAGALDLSLCTLAGQRVRVTDSVRVAGESAWEGENPVDAAVGGRPPTLAECLAAAVAMAAGARLGRDGRTSVFWWRSLERALADENARDRLDAVMQLAAEDRNRHGGTIALRFAGLEVTAGQLIDACAPLTDQSVTALSQLLSRQRDAAWSQCGAGDDTRLLLLGGLHVLRPLRGALQVTVGLDPDCPDGAVVPDNDDLLTASARGAALLAVGRADPGDRYPHGLRVRVNRIVLDDFVTEDLPLAPPGTVQLETTETVYLTVAAVRRERDAGGNASFSGETPAADQEDEDVLITVKPRPTGESDLGVPIPVQIVPRAGAPVPAGFRPAPSPPPGVYKIGVRGGTDGPAVVLQPEAGGAPLVYPLADGQGTAGSQPPALAAS